jgi:hypothetical protein
MKESVRAFLHQIIDYAGLFPPAKLPLEDALSTYLHEKKTSPHRWMLGRFVFPAARLPELLTVQWSRQGTPLLCLTALGQQGSDLSDFLPRLHSDLDAILESRICWESSALIDMLEVALPNNATIEQLEDRLQLAAAQLHQSNLRGFLEVPRTTSWHINVAQIVQVLRDLGKEPLGLKLRCGGVTAEAFPSDEQVAFFISRCRDARIPWKATAGLHHPRRHWDAALNLWHHGFLNVFGAGILAWTHSLTEADLAAILADRDGQHFCVTEDTFAWKQWSCTTAQIADARQQFATSFGSCSFEEPCLDLRAMHWLDASA